jgi:hypothetical protein
MEGSMNKATTVQEVFERTIEGLKNDIAVYEDGGASAVQLMHEIFQRMHRTFAKTQAISGIIEYECAESPDGEDAKDAPEYSGFNLEPWRTKKDI